MFKNNLDDQVRSSQTMVNTPLVSVITPCYNDGKYILETVRSVEKSTYSNIEHIIINDGSTDTYTLEVLGKINNPRVKILHSENQGVCNARNAAIKQSSGKYILPLDGDDLISTEYISKAVAQLEADENVKVVTCNYRLFGKINKSIKIESYSMEKLLGHNLYVVSSFFRRTDFDKVGGFNINMIKGLEDWDFWIAILKLEGRVVVLEGDHFLYRIKPPNLSRNAGTTHEVNKELRRLLWRNHTELYTYVFPDPLQTAEYLNVANSKEYRLGKVILAPIRMLLRFYRGIS